MNMTYTPAATPLRVAAIHDLSCIGRCAQTVILPVLSALGVQVCPLPTALLSTHTGGYTDFTFLDLTNQMEGITKHWHALGETFNAVYSGFLGCSAQITSVLEFVDRSRKDNPDCLFLADPVMGDDGFKYATYTDEMCRLTKKLVTHADIVTPNLTEACILTDKPYKPSLDESTVTDMLKSLCRFGAKTAVITGIHHGNSIGAAYISASTGKIGAYFTARDPHNYPGTGDLFASIVLANQLHGKPLDETVKKACDFIYTASSYTSDLGTPVREGLVFEPLLAELILQK